MKDLENRADLEVLFSAFYDNLLRDPEMHRIFIEVKQVDMQQHLPHILDFWEQLLFDTGSYRKNLMQIHINLSRITPLHEPHFNYWLNTLETTLDTLFSGPNTEKLKTRALSIATMLRIKTQSAH